MRFALGPCGEAVERRIEALVAAEAPARIWRRDASFWGGEDDRARSVANRLGWLDVAAKARGNLDEVTTFAEDVRANGFVDAVLLGMGGSSLAPEVLRQSLATGEGYPALHVLDTTDPASIRHLTERIDLARTLFFVSSKSGTTIEPLSLFAYFHELVVAAVPEEPGRHFVAITDPGTPLEALARDRGFRHLFTNPGDIGGRYSALSYFGIVPAAVAGMDVRELLDRGVAEAERTRQPDSEGLRLGAALGELALAGRDKCTFVVSPEIASFGLWAEQLIAESTGKESRGILPVAGEPHGSPLKYGDDRVFVQLRIDGGYSAEDDAVIGALEAEGQPVIVIDLDDPLDLGREFMRWEFAIAVAGAVLGINPFDEPNVQESKDNTNRVLREFETSGRLDLPEIDGLPVAIDASGSRSGRIAGQLDDLLQALHPRDYFAITAYIEQTRQTDAVFAEVRAIVRDLHHVATTLGYGPRFLHSTGQYHKGGPPRGLFLQVTASEPVDVPVPDKQFTFGQLNRAQSIGDFQALAAHGRPVLRVHLGADVNAGLTQLRDAVRAVAEPTSTGR